MDLNRRHFIAVGAAAFGAAFLAACSTDDTSTAESSPPAQPQRPPETLFRNVRILDVRAGRLGDPTDVMVRGNLIAAIGTGQPAVPGAKIIDGRGRTLMPGLIDNHVHLVFGSATMDDLNDASKDTEFYARAALTSADQMLQRGFTSVRDVGGPIFPLKAAIDRGKARGPRVWPSGAIISQTSGHGDFRGPTEKSRRFTGKQSRAEEIGATFIVDGRDEVLTAARENLRMGASQLKVMAGGGTSSAYDPIDVTQFTLDEMRAAVEAASDWNTYVTVHAYTPRAVRRAVEAGVACVEHGQLLDDATLQLLAERQVWLSGQYLVPSTDAMAPERREKRKAVVEGNSRVWPAAKRLGLKLAWGTDFLFEPAENPKQNSMLLSLREWFSSAELLRLATLDNAALLGLSGPRSPYAGVLGVVEANALADLILVNGDPLAQIDLIADPGKNFDVIMKDGIVYKGQ
ncbi:putative peptidase M38 family protein [Gordonia araii NBRC 100433]|uniref:Putative peptidase M38 family protein n=1 Tax=Gordonia araii NBRC 100433 TaxID=1073574 RepID=G7H5Z4_9ACTN|nr:putative peptidase M38 family protein [Gordonia araii NBRC 100433]